MPNTELLLHAQLKSFRYKVARAMRLVERALAQMPAPYVAFSGGKDSTVTLDLVRRIAPDTPAQYGHEQWILPETEELIRRTPNVVQTALPDRHSEWYTVWDDPSDVPPGVIYVDRDIYTEFNYARELLGFDGCFLGLRKEENSYRYLHLKRRGPLFHCERHGMLECCPIHDWTVMDVWAYIYSRDLDYNRAYDRLSEIGVPLERQRIGPLSQWKALGYGQIAILKRGWPDLWNRFAAAFPEASGYT